jgi:hypothetical protein
MTLRELDYKLGSDGEKRHYQPSPSKTMYDFLSENHLTQKEFAKMLGVSVGAVSQWLSWKRKIPGPVLAFMDLHKRYKFLQEMHALKGNG